MAILTSTSLSWLQKLALLWLGLVLLAAALAPVLPLPYLPDMPDLAHIAQAPFGSGRHWLGTDPQGRDVLSVLVFGARSAVLLTLPAAVLAAMVGAVAGGAAGYWGNRILLTVPNWLLVAGCCWWALRLPMPLLGLAVAAVGGGVALAARLRHRPQPAWPVPITALVMGAAATLDTVPRLVLVVAMAAGTSMSQLSLLALFALTSWPHPARLVRAQMLRVRTLPFIEAAQAAGIPTGRIWLRHALPHALQPLRTAFPLSIAGLLGLESTLSFLGIGLPPDVASWGRLLAAARDETAAWWVFLFPSLCLVFTILSLINLARQHRRTIA